MAHRAHPLVEQLDSARYTLEETVRSLREMALGLEQDPAALQELRSRSDLLYMLKKKYGPGLEDVLAFRIG